MKILVVGDIHGRDWWNTIDPTRYDKIIFLGDYFDSFDISKDTQIENFIDILEFKKSLPDKIILLLGNHDIHYIHAPRYRCTGFSSRILFRARMLFDDNKELFKVAYCIPYNGKSYLFSHAGVSKQWYEENQDIIDQVGLDLLNETDQPVTMADILNHLYTSRHEEILHQVSSMRGGHHKFSGIFWADKMETCNECNFLPNTYQYVGHSPTKEFMTVIGLGNSSSITYCDVLDYKNEFLELEI